MAAWPLTLTLKHRHGVQCYGVGGAVHGMGAAGRMALALWAAQDVNRGGSTSVATERPPVMHGHRHRRMEAEKPPSARWQVHNIRRGSRARGFLPAELPAQYPLPAVHSRYGLTLCKDNKSQCCGLTAVLRKAQHHHSAGGSACRDCLRASYLAVMPGSRGTSWLYDGPSVRHGPAAQHVSVSR